MNWAIQEVSAAAVPNPNERGSAYYDLTRELVLRIEQTPDNKALALAFADVHAARLTRDNVSRLLRQNGLARLADFRVIETDDGATLYVKRGPQWRKGASI
jgi:hypothetical protein